MLLVTPEYSNVQLHVHSKN